MNNMSDKPILIVGAGSVGRRHLQNLRKLGWKNLVLYRTGKSTLPNDEIADIPQEFDLKKALAYKPIATIIASPTALHMPAALAAAKAGSNLFIEKPISDNLKEAKELQRIVRKNRLIAQVGFQFRFHPGLQLVKKLLDEGAIGSVVSTQAHWGEYLPEWHPWEDYRKSYAAKKELGGGVLLTLCHPFDYLHWLIGEVKSVSAQESQNGGLGINVEDTADTLLQFKNGAVGNVHLDFIQKPTEHYLRIIGQNGTIHWNNEDHFVKWYSKISGGWKKISIPSTFERNKMFLDEMKNFLSCIIRGEKPLCTLEDGIYALKIILAAKKSIKDKKIIDLTK